MQSSALQGMRHAKLRFARNAPSEGAKQSKAKQRKGMRLLTKLTKLRFVPALYATHGPVYQFLKFFNFVLNLIKELFI